jgi:methylamine---glutamate N-methyltransferase subunit B
VDAVGGGRRITYDARGLAEPDAAVPRVSVIDGDKASFDAAKLSIRQINLELRWLLYDEGITDVTVANPGAKHSLGVGILTRCRIRFEGSLGYFGCGLIDGPEVTITGRVGWSVCEGMMSGVVMIEKNAGSLTAAGLRGGDVVVMGDVGARTGVDQKGGTIIVLGNGGMNSGFMMQRGRQIFCGDVGPGLGDSIYDGAIFVAGTVKSLGVDCIEAELTAADHEMIARKFSAYDLGSPPVLRKFTSGKQLWNYDNLEPSERKRVL